MMHTPNSSNTRVLLAWSLEGSLCGNIRSSCSRSMFLSAAWCPQRETDLHRIPEQLRIDYQLHAGLDPARPVPSSTVHVFTQELIPPSTVCLHYMCVTRPF